MQERRVDGNFWRDANLVREIARKALFDRADRAVVMQFVAQAERLATPTSPQIHAQHRVDVEALEQDSGLAAD